MGASRPDIPLGKRNLHIFPYHFRFANSIPARHFASRWCTAAWLLVWLFKIHALYTRCYIDSELPSKNLLDVCR